MILHPGILNQGKPSALQFGELKLALFWAGEEKERSVDGRSTF